MSTESNSSKSAVPETPGKFPAPHYSTNQYVNHATSVKHINEWLLDDYRHQLSNIHHRLRDKEALLEGKERDLAEKDTQLRLTKQELSQLKDASIIQFILGILSVVVSSYGINLITTSPPVETGWVLVSIAIILQGISFFMTYQTRTRRNN